MDIRGGEDLATNCSSEIIMSELNEEALRVYNSITEYCETYNIPREHLLDILEDQKVVPMIRGKATEYIGALILKRTLDSRDWLVEKLNLNPQPGIYDEDISVTFRRTGKRLKAETKSAVRGSFKLGTKKTPQPHFKVKSHKSRSHLSKATNDKYFVNDFDILISNVSNAIFRSKPLDRGLPLIKDEEAVKWLKKHYGVSTDSEVRRCAYDDWRICLPKSIALEDNTIPRTPIICMLDDPDWFGPEKLAQKLRSLINGI